MTRRTLDVPTTAPRGSDSTVQGSRATSTSNGIARTGTHAIDSPGLASVGRSLRLCTAASIRCSIRARSNSRTNTPSPPMAEIGTSTRLSPWVEIVTISTGCPWRRSWSTTHSVCVRANKLARVPRRMGRAGELSSACSSLCGSAGVTMLDSPLLRYRHGRDRRGPRPLRRRWRPRPPAEHGSRPTVSHRS